MSDKITVNTDKMAGFIRDLQRMSDKLNDNASSLRRADFSECGGGGVVDSQRIYLKCSGRTVSGSRAPSLVDSFADGLTATGSYVSTLARHVQEALDLFENTENQILAISRDEEAGSKNLESIVSVQAEKPAATKGRVTEKWEKDDSFIDTAYDKQVQEALRNLILNDPDLSEAAWKNCKNDDEREKLLRRVVGKLSTAMGVELTGGLYFLKKEEGESGVVKAYINGKWQKLEFSADTLGGYYPKYDCIALRIDKDYDYVELIGTLCHETRHNLQQEIVAVADLKDSKYVMTEAEYKAVSDEAADWAYLLNDNLKNYYSPTDKVIKKETKAYIKENGIHWWEFEEKKLAEEIVKARGISKYWKQSIEVDARYMEHYAEWTMGLRKELDKQNASVAHGGAGRGFGGGGSH